MLGGIEKTENGSLIAVVYYKDFRTVIPVTEMMIHLMQDEAHGLWGACPAAEQNPQQYAWM